MIVSSTEKNWIPLNARERRVLGVLVEKAKTTPEYYPLTVAGIVTGCNQKSNRDPVTNYDADDVEDILQGLRKKGATVLVEGGGRVVRWKHTLYDWLKVTKVELAVLAELLLRGPQTEGDLRARASRMEPLPDLQSLQSVLEALVPRGLVVSLTPPGQRRGVIVTHGLYLPEELEKARQSFAQQGGEDDFERPARGQPARDEAGIAVSATAVMTDLTALRAEVVALKETVAALAAELGELKSAFGV